MEITKSIFWTSCGLFIGLVIGVGFPHGFDGVLMVTAATAVTSGVAYLMIKHA